MPELNHFYFSFSTAIGNAYAVLSNANKRKQYDQCGAEKSNFSRQGPATGNFEPDISPEDLFNMFFGGGYPPSECSFVFYLSQMPYLCTRLLLTFPSSI